MKTMAHLMVLAFFFNACDSKKRQVYTKLQDNIYQINDQYFYNEAVRTYVIELNDKVLLFDIPTYSKEIEKFMCLFNKPAFAILSYGSCGI